MVKTGYAMPMPSPKHTTTAGSSPVPYPVSGPSRSSNANPAATTSSPVTPATRSPNRFTHAGATQRETTMDSTAPGSRASPDTNGP